MITTDTMPEDFRLLVVQTGGTIDKDYPKRKGGYSFELCDSGALSVLRRVLPSFFFRLVTPCLQDSQDLTNQHRQQILKACQEAEEPYILITHGTDTILQTAAYIATHLPSSPLDSLLHHPLPPFPYHTNQSESTTHLSDQSTTTSHTSDQSKPTTTQPSDQSEATTHSGNQSETAECPMDQSQATVSDHVSQSSATSRPRMEEAVAEQRSSKVIVLTGAFLPERFKDSDADFNVGVVVGAMQGRLPPGVYVALAGRVWRWDHVTRLENGQFVSVS